MAAAYDSYNYPSYWEGREYEHDAELIAIKSLLFKIKKIGRILDIGAGFGRLTPSYIYRAKQVILMDPSAKLLKLARSNIRDKKVRFVQSRLENLNGKIKNGTIDLVVLVRVLHHIENYPLMFSKINYLLKKNGYLILEFANKCHFKANALEFLRGNFTFPIDIFPKDLSRKKSDSLPFLNFHPDKIVKELNDKGFEVEAKISVSNIRSPLVKKILPKEALLFLEKSLQRPLAKVNFGPSIFLLAKKVKFT